MRKKIPEPPEKDRVLLLLEKTHAPDVPKWTTAEQQEARLALKSLAFHWFRVEKLLDT